MSRISVVVPLFYFTPPFQPWTLWSFECEENILLMRQKLFFYISTLNYRGVTITCEVKRMILPDSGRTNHDSKAIISVVRKMPLHSNSLIYWQKRITRVVKWNQSMNQGIIYTFTTQKTKLVVEWSLLLHGIREVPA